MKKLNNSPPNQLDFEKLLTSIPEEYKILDHLLELRTKYWIPEVPVFVLSPVNLDVTDWYQNFEEGIFSSYADRRFFPVIRASDGEYRFLLGPQPPSRRETLKCYLYSYLKYVRAKLSEKRSGFTGQTAPGVSVGKYSSEQLRQGREIFDRGLQLVLEKGLLAAHLQFAPKPFQECYHPAFKRYLDARKLLLSWSNYIPFYFVYLFLSRIATGGLLRGRRVLFVNGADEAKKNAIDSRFRGYGVNESRWVLLSKDRSLFDEVRLSEADQSCDLCFLGGGVGKFNVIQQLSEFPGPVIDAGYYFEAWANPAIAHRRPLCIV